MRWSDFAFIVWIAFWACVCINYTGVVLHRVLRETLRVAFSEYFDAKRAWLESLETDEVSRAATNRAIN